MAKGQDLGGNEKSDRKVASDMEVEDEDGDVEGDGEDDDDDDKG